MKHPNAELVPGSSARAMVRRAADLITTLLVEGGDLAEVEGVLIAHGERPPLRLSTFDIEQMRFAARSLHEVFEAENVDHAAQLLNDILAVGAYPPRLTTHGGAFPWHLHIDSHDDGPWGEWLLTSSCLGLAVLLADRQTLPCGICAAPGCGKPFADTGSGSRRRYCSSRCATRERVAAHRKSKSSAT